MFLLILMVVILLFAIKSESIEDNFEDNKERSLEIELKV